MKGRKVQPFLVIPCPHKLDISHSRIREACCRPGNEASNNLVPRPSTPRFYLTTAEKTVALSWKAWYEVG